MGLGMAISFEELGWQRQSCARMASARECITRSRVAIARSNVLMDQGSEQLDSDDAHLARSAEVLGDVQDRIRQSRGRIAALRERRRDSDRRVESIQDLLARGTQLLAACGRLPEGT